MGSVSTAIIHLREGGSPPVAGLLEKGLRLARGVEEVSYEPADRMIAVRFDEALISLAELVRTVEDAGSPVGGVAQRRLQRLASRPG